MARPGSFRILQATTLLLFTSAFLSNCATVNNKRSSAFSYRNIYKKKYERGNGGMISLTLEKGEAVNGSFTPDRQYFVFSGNQKGNFDIYLRPLHDIINIPILEGATNQTEPSISPDGKNIVFIDDELDPDGDIVILPIKPATIEKIYFRKGQAAIDARLANKKKYLTNNPQAINRSREINPSWSPDGKWIAYASNRASRDNRFGPGFGAPLNIWILPINRPENARQITSDGGSMPVFSPDGKKILFVRENRDSKASHIFEVDISTKESHPVTTANAIDLYPAYSNDGKKIIFTRISKDTNGDGVVNLKDNGQIVMLPLHEKDPKEKDKEPELRSVIGLTDPDDNIFNTRVSPYMGGSIVFAIKKGDSINLAFIPEGGTIPARKTAIDQYSYILDREKKSSEETVKTAFELLDYVHSGDPLLAFASSLKDFHLLEEAGPEKERLFMAQIRRKISKGDSFEKTLLDLYYKKHPAKTPDDYTFTYRGKNTNEYLASFYENPFLLFEPPKENTGQEIEQKIEQEKTQKPDKNLTPYKENAIAYLLEKYAQALEQQGQVELAQKVYQSILFNFPAYFRSSQILYTLGHNSLTSEIPPEYLFILFPNSYTYSTKNFIPALQNAQSDQEERKLTVKPSPKIVFRVEREVFEFFVKANDNNQRNLLENLTRIYSPKEYPYLYNLILLAKAKNLMDHDKYKAALVPLRQISVSVFAGKQWVFYLNYYMGKCFEKNNLIEKAYAFYQSALLNYNNSYEFESIDSLSLNVISYFRKVAEVHGKSGNLDNALHAYFPLIKLLIYMEPNQISEKIVSQISFRVFMDMDKLILGYFTPDNPSIKTALDFYDSNIEYARRHIIKSFIFGRAYLNAMLGIKLHKIFEEKRLLYIQDNKNMVLSFFYSAEEDFQWTIYADPTFPDAYVMLGWMYQYIDEKRDSDVYFSVIGNESKKDKELFKALYKKYFPDYLFEKNIQIYQKSISFIKEPPTSRITQSFYLNLANNYFLLKNFSKANENYQKIILKGKNKYIFESRNQEAYFYFHYGKSGYFSGDYQKSTSYLEKALSFFPPKYYRDPKQRENLYRQRTTINKYLALCYSDQGKYEKSAEIFQQVISELKRAEISEDPTVLYLEAARNLVLQMKLNHNLKYYGHTLNLLNLAERSLKNAKTVYPPRLHTQWKILSLIPLNFPASYDTYQKGESHLIFTLPTVNRKEYLYSLRADLLKLNGNYRQAIVSLQNLIETAKSDTSDIGHQTHLAALMRLGELYYIKGDLNNANDVYSEAANISFKKSQMRIYYMAEKNLMNIACQDIENASGAPLKIKKAQGYLQNLDDFKKNYIKTKINIVKKNIKKKNVSIKLTLSEKIRIEKEAIKEISKILLFRGVFETYLVLNHAGGNDSKVSSMDDFLAQKRESYKNLTGAISSLQGEISINGDYINLFDRKTEKRTAMIMDMNKGLAYEAGGDTGKAMDIYENLANQAYEFKANELYLVAGFRYYEIAKSTHPDKAFKILRKIDALFRIYPYLMSSHPNIYQLTSKAMIRENIANKQYANAIYLENFNRHLSLLPLVDPVLSNISDEKLKNLYEYKELEKAIEILASDIEDLRIRRESTDSLDFIMDQLLNRRKSILNKTLNSPDLRGYALARFPESIGLREILDIEPAYLYIIQDGKLTKFLYKHPGENRYDVAGFKINPSEITSVTEFLKDGEWGSPSSPEMSGEFKRMIRWIKGKNFGRIYPNLEFMLFPFSKILGHPVARNYTVEASLLYEKNKTVSASRWLENKSFENPLAKSLMQPEVIQISQASDFDRKKPDFNAIDYEVEADDFANKASVLSKILDARKDVSIALVSYNVKTPEKLAFYVSASDLIFAAANVSLTVQSPGPRSQANQNFSNLFSNEPEKNTAYFYSGNPEISRAYFSADKESAIANRIELQKKDLYRCDQVTQQEKRRHEWQNAVNNLSRCENIEQNLQYQILLKNKSLEKDNIELLEPDYRHFLEKADISLAHLTGALPELQNNYSDIKKRFLQSVSQSGPQSGGDSGASQLSESQKQKQDHFNAFNRKYTSILFKNSFIKEAMGNLNYFSGNYAFNTNDFKELLGGYYLGQLYQGNLAVFQKAPPAELTEKFPDYSGLKIPENLAAKVRYFANDNNTEWVNALIQSGEYDVAKNFPEQSFGDLTLWQKISFLVYTGQFDFFSRPDPEKKDPLIARKIGNLLGNPEKAENYGVLAASPEAGEPLKLFSQVVLTLSENNYAECREALEGFQKYKPDDNDPDSFFIRQSLSFYLISKADFTSMPESFYRFLLATVSRLTAGDVANLQQKDFLQLAKSSNTFSKEPQKLEDFFKGSGPENFKQPSDLNRTFAQSLYQASLYLNPAAVLSPDIQTGLDNEGKGNKDNDKESNKEDNKNNQKPEDNPNPVENFLKNPAYIKTVARLNAILTKEDKKQNPDFNRLNPHDLSLLFKYYIGKAKNDSDLKKAILAYLAYDRDENPASFKFERTLTGLFKVFEDQYYLWSWGKNKVKIDKIAKEDISKALLAQRDNVFYLPARDRDIANRLLFSDTELKYFTVTSDPSLPSVKDKNDGENKDENKNNDENQNGQKNQDGQKISKDSWTYDPSLKEQPGYSLLNMYMPDQTALDFSWIGYRSNYEKQTARQAKINFYSQAIDYGTILHSPLNDKMGNYHVLYTNPAILNIYLTFMKEFIIKSKENSGKPGVQAMDIFDQVYKQLAKKYSAGNDLRYLIIIQK